MHEFVLQTLLRPGCAERQKSLVTLTTALATDVDAGTGKLRCTAVHSWSESGAPELGSLQGRRPDLTETLGAPDSRRNWDPATSTPLTEPQWMQLCYAAEHVLSQERSCLQLRAPIKVFGDLHGARSADEAASRCARACAKCHRPSMSPPCSTGPSHCSW